MNARPPDRQPRPHTPQRPLWLCRRCAQPWPWGQAKLDLLRELATEPAYLRIYLAAQMHEALRDLNALTPYEMPTPEAAWNRFLSWAAPPTPPTAPPTPPTAPPTRRMPRRRSI